MKKNKKKVFFNGHKCKNMIKYKRNFLSKIKILLSYFIEFDKNKSILPKKYLKNYLVEGLD